MEETTKTYNIVSEGWNNFRQRPFFPDWFDFLSGRWKEGSLLDVGCGNGRNMLPFANDFSLIGIDSSSGMIENAKTFAEKKDFDAKFIVSDANKMPFENSSIDNAICVAVYHHMNPKELPTALDELHRILKSNGEAFITVWSRLQWKFIFKSPDQKIPWKRRKDDKIYYRYYHLYTPWEIKRIINDNGFSIVLEGVERSLKKKTLSKNICLLVRKRE